LLKFTKALANPENTGKIEGERNQIIPHLVGWVIMKKAIIAVLMVGLLAGCGKHETHSTKSLNSSIASSKRAASRKKTSEKKAEKDKATATDTTSSSSSAAKTTTADSNIPANYTALQAAILKITGNQWLPSHISANMPHINSTAARSGNTTTVRFFGGTAALAVNDAQLKGDTPLYQLKRTTYATTSAAAAQVNWHDSEGLTPNIDLGDKQVATQEGAAGSTYLHWNEGRWSLTVQATNATQEDPVPLAKQLVELFRTRALPVPTTHGAATFHYDDGQQLQVVTWNSGNVLYEFAGNNAYTTATTTVR
jgi:hypothetical protein